MRRYHGTGKHPGPQLPGDHTDLYHAHRGGDQRADGRPGAVMGVFYRAGYIESWGARGIQKICDACKMLGADEPEYIVHGGDIMLKFNAFQSAKVPESTSQLP